MSNRNMPNRQFSSTRDRKTVDAKVSFGATGAPTLTANPYVKSVTRNAQGKFTFVFGNALGLDIFVKLVGARVIYDTSGVGADAIAAAPFMVILSNDTADATKASIQVAMLDGDTPAQTDPASGEVGYFTFEFGDSGVL